jgi:hypothetical protein
MKKQGLAPGVKNSQRPDTNTEPAQSDVGQGCACGTEEKIVELTWCPSGKDVELLRNREDDVEVGNWK